MDGIVCDEQTRLVVIERMLLHSREQSVAVHQAELTRKFGYGSSINPSGLRGMVTVSQD